MKRLSVSLCVLALLGMAVAQARVNVATVGGGVPVAAGTYCCDSPDDASLLCEDFGGSTECVSGEASTCRAAWTLIGASSASVVFNEVASIDACNNESGYAFKNTAVVGADDFHARTFTNTQDYYVSFMLIVNSESLADGHYAPILRTVQSDGTTYNVRVRIAQVSGNLKIDLSDDGGASYQSTANLSTGTWYEISFLHKGTATKTMQLWIDGASDGSTTTNVSSSSADRVWIGSYAPDANIEFEITSIKINATARPSSCGT